MDRTFWDAVFGNPPFAPHLEVMSFEYRNLEPMPITPIAVPENNSVLPATIEDIASQIEMPIDVDIPIPVPDTLDPEVQEEEKPQQETGLIPVDSVIYSIDTNEKPKKSFFGRKK